MMTDKYVSVRLPWRVICRLACKACCMNVSFDEVCEAAMRDYMTPRMVEA